MSKKGVLGISISYLVLEILRLFSGEAKLLSIATDHAMQIYTA